MHGDVSLWFFGKGLGRGWVRWWWWWWWWGGGGWWCLSPPSRPPLDSPMTTNTLILVTMTQKDHQYYRVEWFKKQNKKTKTKSISKKILNSSLKMQSLIVFSFSFFIRRLVIIFLESSTMYVKLWNFIL